MGTLAKAAYGPVGHLSVVPPLTVYLQGRGSPHLLATVCPPPVILLQPFLTLGTYTGRHFGLLISLILGPGVTPSYLAEKGKRTSFGLTVQHLRGLALTIATNLSLYPLALGFVVYEPTPPATTLYLWVAPDVTASLLLPIPILQSSHPARDNRKLL